MSTSLYHDLEATKMMAIHYASEHDKNYNVILANPNEHGEFDAAKGSTYEIVQDSYFEKERPNAIRLHKTDDLVKIKEDNICPMTKEPCRDECCPPGATCNLFAGKLDAEEWAKSQDMEFRDDNVKSMSALEAPAIDSSWPVKKIEHRRHPGDFSKKRGKR